MMHILIADDNALFPRALGAALSRLDSRFKVLPCASLEQAVRESTRLMGINLVILGRQMKGMNTATGICYFRCSCPDMPVALLSSNHNKRDVIRAMELGVSGFFPMNLTVEGLAAALKLIRLGQRFMPPEIISSTHSRAQASRANDIQTLHSICNLLDHLGASEKEVLEHFLQDLEERDNPRDFGIDEDALGERPAEILRELSSSAHFEAVKLAIRGAGGSC